MFCVDLLPQSLRVSIGERKSRKYESTYQIAFERIARVG